MFQKPNNILHWMIHYIFNLQNLKIIVNFLHLIFVPVICPHGCYGNSTAGGTLPSGGHNDWHAERGERVKIIIKKTERGRKKEQYASQSVELVLPQEIQNLRQL